MLLLKITTKDKNINLIIFILVNNAIILKVIAQNLYKIFKYKKNKAIFIDVISVDNINIK
jgi:hypothetical protein